MLLINTIQRVVILQFWTTKFKSKQKYLFFRFDISSIDVDDDEVDIVTAWYSSLV